MESEEQTKYDGVGCDSEIKMICYSTNSKKKRWSPKYMSVLPIKG